MIFKKSIKTQIEESEEKIENCKEAKMVLDSAIRSTFLLDSHSLICQKWIKEYDQKIEDLKNFLEGAYNEQ